MSQLNYRFLIRKWYLKQHIVGIFKIGIHVFSYRWRREGQKASFYPHIHTLLGEIWAGALNVFFKQRWYSNLYIRYSLSHLWHMSSCIYLIFASNILWICIIHPVNVSQFKATPWINVRCWYILCFLSS